MVSDISHAGGCLCGQVRYEVQGEPLLNGICHCRYCQCRTGSAFGVNIYFHKSNVHIVSGEVKSFSVLIGPEGDFSPSERELILQTSNIIPFTLSKNILRSDTAVISAISLVNFINNIH